MEPLTPGPESEQTRQRLLDAAEELFADKGLEGSTVREICERAGARNVAAVNYHFGSKEKLYAEAVQQAFVTCKDGAPFPEWGERTPPAKKLRDFIGVLILRMMNIPRISAMKLMMREFTAPTPPCIAAVRQNIFPMAGLLHDILVELLPGTAADLRWLIGFSIVGQCLYYRTCRVPAETLIGAEAFARLQPATVADHIANFTLAGLGIEPATSVYEGPRRAFGAPEMPGGHDSTNQEG